MSWCVNEEFEELCVRRFTYTVCACICMCMWTKCTHVCNSRNLYVKPKRNVYACVCVHACMRLFVCACVYVGYIRVYTAACVCVQCLICVCLRTHTYTRPCCPCVFIGAVNTHPVMMGRAKRGPKCPGAIYRGQRGWLTGRLLLISMPPSTRGNLKSGSLRWQELNCVLIFSLA